MSLFNDYTNRIAAQARIARLGASRVRALLQMKDKSRKDNFRDRRRLPGDGGDAEATAEDDDLKAWSPAVHEYLTSPGSSPGGEGQTATLLFFAEGPLFKVCLNDRSYGVSAFASGSTLMDAIKALDDSIQSGTCDWRENKKGRR